MENFLTRGMVASFSYLILSVSCLLLVKDPLQSMLLASLFAMCLIPWFFWRAQPNVFAPIYYTSLFLLIIYPVRTVFLLVFPDYAVSIFPPPYNPELVNKVLTYSLIGVGAYILFYYGLPIPPLPQKAVTPAHSHSQLKGWVPKIMVIYVAGWCARAYQIQTGNFRTWVWGEGYDITTYTLLTYIGEVCEIGYILTWIYWLKREKRKIVPWILLLGISAVELAFALTVQGSKIPLVRLMLFPLIASYLIKGRLRLTVLVPVSLAVVFFVFPFVQAYRDFYEERFGQLLEISLEDGASIALDAIGGMYGHERHYTAGLAGDSSIWLFASVVFLNRFHGFESLALVLENVPRPFGFVYGKDLLMAPLALIPRAIWNDKPISNVAPIFDYEIVQSTGISSNCPYPIAEGYFNAGLLGVLLVMLTLAMLQRVVYSGFFLARRQDPFSVGVYIWLFIWVVELGTWVLPAYTYLVQRLVILGVVWLLFNGSLLRRKEILPIRIQHENCRA